jgi:hypothetical protein
MEEGRQALDGWRTAGPTSFGAALGPAAPEVTPGGLNSPGESERWGGWRSLPPEIGGHRAEDDDSEPLSLWGGGAKTVPGRVCPQEHPPVCVVVPSWRSPYFWLWVGTFSQVCLSPPLVKALAPYVLWIFSGCVPHMLVSRPKRAVSWRDCDGQR